MFQAQSRPARARRGRAAALLCLSLALFMAAPRARAQDAPAKLSAGEPVTRELQGGTVHTYRLDAGAGQFLQLVVNQMGIDVVVLLYGPGGGKLAEVDSPNGTSGPEPVFAIAKDGGEYRVEVRSLEKTAPVGRYEVRLAEVREATPLDEKRIAAERLFAEATMLYSQGTAEGFRQAAVKYAESLPLFREVGEQERLAAALQAIGAIHFDRGDTERAAGFYQQTLDIRRASGDRRGLAESLNNLANVHQRRGEFPRATELLNESLAIFRELGDPATTGVVLSNLGHIYALMSEERRALEYFREALPLLRAAGNRYSEIITLNNVGNSHIDLGEPQLAMESFQRAYELALSLGNKTSQATALAGLGRAHDVFGDLGASVRFRLQALELSRVVGEGNIEAATLLELGDSYFKLEDYAKAADYSRQAAEKYHAQRSPMWEGIAYKTLGLAHSGAGDYARASEAFEKALPLVRSVGDRFGEALTVNAYGEVFEKTGDFGRAREMYDRAVEQLRALGARRNLSVALYAVAHVERERGNLAESLKNVEEAISINEAISTGILSDELRSAYRGSVQRLYELRTDVLMRLHARDASAGHDRQAFLSNETSRARSLLELLAEARADVSASVAPGLAERERELRRRLNELAARQSRLLREKKAQEQAAALSAQVDALALEHRRVEAEIRKSSPRFGSLTRPQPVSPREIQTALLGRGTALLEYSLGEKASYLWVVTEDSFKSYELPAGSVIQAQAKKVYALLTARNSGAGVAQDEAAYAAEADALSRMILAPVAAEELAGRRLLVVADGALQYLPFAALPLGGRMLIEGHEVINLPSASVLAELRRSAAGRKPAPRSLAVLADPVFDSSDPRVKRQAARKEAGSNSGLDKTTADESLRRSFEEAAGEGELKSIPRLPFSRREAEAILGGVTTGDALRAVDFGASVETATNGALAQYRFVHFATHGLLNSRRPELSGLVLSLVDERGEPVNGFLRLNDIYNLKLNADLVVLSACQTALGRDVRGEGLVGLTRGLMYAGAPRVVASLWKVDDAATAELMRRFYEGVLSKKLRPAEALRAAQLEMARGPRFGSPYFWAAFTIQGDWR